MKSAARAAAPTIFEKLEERRMLALTPLGGEFLVPTTTNNHQRNPAIAMDADGDFVIAWSSYYVTGATYELDDVLIQRYKKDGTPLGSEFLVNTYTTGNQHEVAVAMSDGGSFVVVWTSWGQDEPFDDNNPGALRKGIFAQRFNVDGTAAGSEFAVNTFTTGDQFDPSVAMDSSGNFVVSWTSQGQEGGSDFGVYARKFSASGVGFATEFAVNTVTTGNQQASSVAIDSEGNFVVAWQSYSSDFGVAYDVFARRYDSAGGPLGGSEFQVNTITGGAQINPSVAMDTAGNFLVAFEDYAVGDIYMRRYDAAGAPQGVATVANIDNGIESAPVAAMDSLGNFVIAWVGPDGSGAGVIAQHFNSSGVKLGAELIVNTEGVSDQRSPAVAMADAGNVGFAWMSSGQDGSLEGIYGQLYEQQGPPPWPYNQETQIHSFTTGAQINPAVSAGAGGDIIVVWQSFDQDGEGWGIYGQRYNGLGIARGLEFRINSVTEGDQTRPVVAVSPSGEFVVLWESSDSSGSGIFGRMFNSLGVPATDDFQVNEVNTGDQSRPDVAMDDDGNFVTVWESDGIDLDGDIVYRKYNSSGAAMTSEVTVNTYTTGAQTTPAIAMNLDGDFVITWVSTDQPGDAGKGIYAQRYESNLALNGSEFHVNSYTTGDQLDPDVGMDSAGNFVIVWQSLEQLSPGLNSIHLQRFGVLGAAAGSEIHVDGGATVGGSSPAVAMDAAGNFVVVWQENEDPVATDDEDAGIYATRFNGDGSVRTANIRINTFTTAGQVTPAIATSPVGDIAIVWTDEVRDNNVDQGIFGRRLEHLTTTIVSGGAEFPINTFTTGNQFNSTVAVNEDGESIVVWQSPNQTDEDNILIDAGYGIYAQRYNAAGNRVGTEFHVNTFTTGQQQNAVVAWGPDGSFIIAWQTNSFTGGAGGGDIVARRYDAEGEAIGTEFMVNSYTTNFQADPSIAIEDDADGGSFAIAWRSFQQVPGGGYDVYVRRYNAAGESLDTEFRVNTVTQFNQNQPAVAMDDDGNFVVTWATYVETALVGPQHFNIAARRYDVGLVDWSSPEFLVNTYTTNAQTNPQIAMQPTGEFLIVWESNNQAGLTSGLDIYAQRYTIGVGGVPVANGGEFQVNTYTTGSQSVPVVAVDDDGDFTIAWASYLQDGEANGIFAERYNSSADPQGEMQVNVWTTAAQFAPSVAMDPDGAIIITWQSTGGQDGNLAGVFGRRFEAAAINPVVLTRSFIWQSAPQRILFQVDRNVSASLNVDGSDLILQNLTTNTFVSGVQVSFNPVTNGIIFTFPSAPNGGALPDGRYRATLIGSGVFDAAGNNIGPDQVLEFYFINGDANHDGYVDARDLYLLSQKWLQSSGFSYSAGDFDYDGDVDQADLTILAQHWQISLASLAPALPAPPAPTPTSPAPAPAPEPTPEPTPAPTPPRRAPVRTPVRNTELVSTPPQAAPAAPAVAAQPAPAPEPAPSVSPVVAPEPEPTPVPVPAVVETPAPVVSPVFQQTPPPAPVVQQETPAPTPAPVVSAPAPTEPAPVAQQPAPTSPFASTLVRAEAPTQAPPKRAASRTPIRSASLVDL